METPELFPKMNSVIVLYHTNYVCVFDIFDVIKYNLKQLKYYSVTVICSHCAFLRGLSAWHLANFTGTVTSLNFDSFEL